MLSTRRASDCKSFSHHFLIIRNNCAKVSKHSERNAPAQEGRQELEEEVVVGRGVPGRGGQTLRSGAGEEGQDDQVQGQERSQHQRRGEDNLRDREQSIPESGQPAGDSKFQSEES